MSATTTEQPRPTAGPTPEPTPVDVFSDPIVQLAAICPICALAALKPEAALAALSPTLALFNPAINPRAALLSFGLSLSLGLSERTAGLARKQAESAGRVASGGLYLRARLQQRLTT